MAEEKKQWKREFSAGGVVFKKSGEEILILLIKPSGQTKNKDSKWTFPKGWVNAGEKSEVAAVREVKEEGGVEAKIIESLGSVKYTFKWEEENIFKIVTYYLMEYVSGDPANHDFEVLESKWFTFAEAENNISYKTDKEVFEKAKRALSV